MWDWQSRAESISYRDLRAVRMLLTNMSREHEPSFGARLRHMGVSTVGLQCDNTATVLVINAMVSASRPMMRELRLLKRELDRLKVHIDARWLPSVLNKYADALSRRFPRGGLRIRRSLRRSVADGMRAPATEFPYRPLGENPVLLRRQSMAALQTTWVISETRVLCPPIDLLPATVRKLRHSGYPAVLLMRDWPAQAWHPAALQLSTHAFRLPHPPHMAWDGARKLKKEWSLLLLEINLPPDPGRWHDLGPLEELQQRRNTAPSSRARYPSATPMVLGACILFLACYAISE